MQNERHGPASIMSFCCALVVGLGLVAPSTCSRPESVRLIPCLDAANLQHVISCIQEHMPSVDTEGYQVPSRSVRRAWAKVVDQMLAGDCEDVHLPRALRGNYRVRPYTDVTHNQRYCLLVELVDQVPHFPQVDLGWGTLIVNPEAVRELSIQIPHPQYERGTAGQGVGIFQALSARSLLIAGTHRNANAKRSSCQSRYREADAGHNTAHLFQATAEAVQRFYVKTDQVVTVLQFHGMAYFDCKGIDVYMTYGGNVQPEPQDALMVIRTQLARENPKWSIRVPGEQPRCGLHGQANIQGRLANGVTAASVCDTPATAVSKRFISIEQAPGHYRDPAHWIGALTAAFPR